MVRDAVRSYEGLAPAVRPPRPRVLGVDALVLEPCGVEVDVVLHNPNLTGSVQIVGQLQAAHRESHLMFRQKAGPSCGVRADPVRPTFAVKRPWRTFSLISSIPGASIDEIPDDSASACVRGSDHASSAGGELHRNFKFK